MFKVTNWECYEDDTLKLIYNNVENSSANNCPHFEINLASLGKSLMAFCVVRAANSVLPIFFVSAIYIQDTCMLTGTFRSYNHKQTWLGIQNTANVENCLTL